MDRDLIGMVIQVLQGTPKSRTEITPLSAVFLAIFKPKMLVKKSFSQGIYRMGQK